MLAGGVGAGRRTGGRRRRSNWQEEVEVLGPSSEERGPVLSWMEHASVSLAVVPKVADLSLIDSLR
eukprot:7927129-Pyramimonas_sp.AAC.1